MLPDKNISNANIKGCKICCLDLKASIHMSKQMIHKQFVIKDGG